MFLFTAALSNFAYAGPLTETVFPTIRVLANAATSDMIPGSGKRPGLDAKSLARDLRLVENAVVFARGTHVSHTSQHRQYGLGGIMSHASTVVTRTGPPLENNATSRLSLREG